MSVNAPELRMGCHVVSLACACAHLTLAAAFTVYSKQQLVAPRVWWVDTYFPTGNCQIADMC
jgi:hypothetical protein